MLKRLLALFLLLGFVGVTVGCEAEGRIDDDNGRAKIEIEDD